MVKILIGMNERNFLQAKKNNSVENWFTGCDERFL